ncbi:cutinase family protein [Nocardia takedensis]|uniref:cutinase family protein n=1 Tax=Nocardia takedensis TaxID=259390 RepID=UPI00030BC7C4|nr:cutinase family protein [Nocardia takedensis]
MWGAAACTAAAALMTGSAAAAAEPPAAIPDGAPCPALLVLGVQGTGQSTPYADPHTDSGMLGLILGPTLADHPEVVRAYVPYDAGFGAVLGTGTGRLPFADSVDQARHNLTEMATTALGQCPDTRLAAVGYSQGALAVSEFAQQVGTGAGPVAPEQVAGVALLSNPAKNPGVDPLPGRPGQTTPDPAPGADGSSTSTVRLNPVPANPGIVGAGVDYAELSGRVGELCVPADLACDAPTNAAALRTAAGVLAQADLGDPVTAVESVGAAWSATVAETGAAVILDDLSITEAGVDYAPRQSISQRIADAAQPGPGPHAGSEQAVADKVAALTAAVVADPLAQIPRLAGQVLAALPQVAADNADLLDPAVLGQLFTAPAHHTGYGPTGHTRQAADWLGALAEDLSTP